MGDGGARGGAGNSRPVALGPPSLTSSSSGGLTVGAVVVVVSVVIVVAIVVSGMTGWIGVVGGPVGALVGVSVTLRDGATGGSVGMAVILGGLVMGTSSWPDTTRASPSSRSRGHTPILP